MLTVYRYFGCLGRRILGVPRRALVLGDWRKLFGRIGLPYHPDPVVVGDENIGEKLLKLFRREALQKVTYRRKRNTYICKFSRFWKLV